MEEKRLNKRRYGLKGEKIAGEFLKGCGYEILETNYRIGRFGEIDIIARQGEYICFIEVKTRSSTVYGMPCEAVNRKKREKLVKLAQLYLLKTSSTNASIRFDIVEIIAHKTAAGVKAEKINLLQNAFINNWR